MKVLARAATPVKMALTEKANSIARGAIATKASSGSSISTEEPAKHHMELRGLGIVNVKDLFGLAAVRERKTIDLVVRLEHWEEGKPYERLGLDETVFEILGTPVPYIRMPVATGRNIANLVEIAARNHVLKLQGHDSARELVRKLEAELERRRKH